MLGRLMLAALLALSGASIGLAQEVSAPAPAPAERPIEAFALLPRFTGALLSPDGTRLAVKMRVADQQILAIVSLARPNDDPALMTGGGVIDINSWQWVNDDWLVVSVGIADRTDGREAYVSRLLGVDRHARILNRLAWQLAAQNASDILWVARDGTPRIRFAMQTAFSGAGLWPRVVEADVSTGRTDLVVGSRDYVMDWVADASGTVRMGVGYDDERGRARLLYRARANEDFQTIARADTRREESLAVPTLFLADSNRAVAISNHEGFDAAYEMSLPDLTLGRRLFGVAGHDIDDILPTRSGDGIAGVFYTDTAARVTWLDPEMRQIQANLDTTFGAGRARIVSSSRDRSKMLVLVGGPSQAGAYYVHDVAAASVSRIAWLHETFRDEELAPVRTIRYRARDGVEIAAVLTLPLRRAARALPVIVMPHGGPNVRDEEQWDWIAQFLADRGYAVIQPNYRGSSGYGARFAALGRGEWGRKMQDDLDDALAFLAQEGIADPARACILGGSYGGYAALRAAQRSPAVYRCAISYAGVSDLNALIRYDRNFLNSRREQQWLEAQAPDLREVSPINHAADFSIPVLLMHGDRDVVVPVSQSRRMADRLRSADKAVRYVEQAGGDHHFSRGADRLQFLREVQAFLDRHDPA
ncbi:MAG TPA: S9 family peptidase [Allosphingosinicella sp.]|nr:S9 family peptidase [Allosphingosinicella sp.]